MILRELVRDCLRHREIDEGDERHGLDRGVIDRDFVRRAILLEHNDVGISEQQIKCFDNEDRRRGGEPGTNRIDFRAAFDDARQPPIEHQELADGDAPQADDTRKRRGRRVSRQAERIKNSHQRKQCELALDIDRCEAEIDPVVRARDAALDLRQAAKRQRRAGEIERNDGFATDVRRQQKHRGCAENSDAGGDAGREPAAAAEIAAQQRELAVLGVFGNEALRGRAEAEIDHAADQQHPRPGIDVDAEFEDAHPSRQQNLRDKGDGRTDDADKKGRARQPARQRGLAAVGKQRMNAGDAAAERCPPRGRAPLPTRRLFGTN